MHFFRLGIQDLGFAELNAATNDLDPRYFAALYTVAHFHVSALLSLGKHHLCVYTVMELNPVRQVNHLRLLCGESTYSGNLEGKCSV